MQFHLNGYAPGDPRVLAADPSVVGRGSGLPETVDVLIVGAGPAGLVLAAQLAHFPEIRTLVVDRRDGPLAVGQADGVACRTVEMFEAFGLASQLLEESYWVNEVCFWRPDPDDKTRIKRTGRVVDTEEGLSEFPHVIVNQARMLAFLLEHMQRSPSRSTPLYGLQVTEVDVQRPRLVTVTLVHTGTGESSTIQARYVVGCDGSRSRVRTAVGRELVGDVTDERWGVMDVLCVTDFPDIRVKSAITSAHGNVLIIPREGGHLVRFYVELDRTGDKASVTPEKLADAVRRILHPYALEIRDVAWSSVYEIGQRLCDRFDDVRGDGVGTPLPQVFIAGDACHTHSAKAGQGMNVSMADAWNLGWKLAAVLRGTARPEVLHTYSDERQAVAQELIDFDREFSKLFSTRQDGVGPKEFEHYFVRQGRFTAGVATRYATSMITAAGTFQDLAAGYPIGMRFHSAPVIRLADAKPVHLGHAARADGAWRLYLFADRSDLTSEHSRVRELCSLLDSDPSLLRRFTPAEAEPDSVIDVLAVFQPPHRDLPVDRMPPILLPRKGRFGLIDYEKMFCPDPTAGDIFDVREVDRDTGCMVVVRPDQYVANVLPLDAHEALADFFSGILVDVH